MVMLAALTNDRFSPGLCDFTLSFMFLVLSKYARSEIVALWFML